VTFLKGLKIVNSSLRRDWNGEITQMVIKTLLPGSRKNFNLWAGLLGYTPMGKQ